MRCSGQVIGAVPYVQGRVDSLRGDSFVVQPDGNAVLRDPQGRVRFQTRTRGAGAVLLVQPDGNLVLRAAGRVLWSSGTSGAGPVLLVMQEDGNLVLSRQSDGRVVWSALTGRRS